MRYNALQPRLSITFNGRTLFRERVSAIGYEGAPEDAVVSFSLFDADGACTVPVGNMLGAMERADVRDSPGVLTIGLGLTSIWHATGRPDTNGYTRVFLHPASEGVAPLNDGDADNVYVEQLLTEKQLAHLHDLAEGAGRGTSKRIADDEGRNDGAIRYGDMDRT